MSVKVVLAGDSPTDRTARRVALVNNMPDAALAATERQFVGLLGSAAGEDIEVRLYTMDGIARAEASSSVLAGRYRPLSHLLQDPPSALVVTGTEPLAGRIEDEAYWSELVELLRWGLDCVPAVLVSCLAAHAALATFDGLERVRLPAKLTGVYAQLTAPDHALARGLAASVPVPHSRRNDVPTRAVEEAGWKVAVGGSASAAGVGPDPGWAVITSRRAGATVTAVQGHPEYDASSLLREYRRDAERYLVGEAAAAPTLPTACVAPIDRDSIAAFDASLRQGRREPARIDAFDFAGAGLRAEWSWRDAAVRLYRNWLESFVASTPAPRRRVAH